MRTSAAYLIILIFFLGSPFGLASDIRVGLFYGKEIKSAIFSVVEGEYILSSDDRQIVTLLKGSIFHIDYSSEGIVVSDTEQTYGVFASLEFKGISAENVFLVKPVFPSLESKEYDDDLLIDKEGSNLKIINRIDLEKYVAGTIEAEGGVYASLEYYKAQAVLARTYAVKNYHRHAFEGFNLCDGQHCQAFNGKSHWNDDIVLAVTLTANEILVNKDNQPVNTPYHANCGGITSSASMVWNEDMPYLIPVKDPFCVESAHHQWRKDIPVAEWRNYLQGKGALFAYLPDNPIQKPERRKYLSFGNKEILLSNIREDLELQSTFFTIGLEGDSIIMNGFGYGHGVGLCQEGAMEMARVGFVYIDILMFYFRNLTLSQYSD